MRPALALSALAIALAGCAAPQDCDPTRTTFLSGIGCAAGGGYAARQGILAGEQRAAVDRMSDARSEARDAAGRERAARADLAAARQRVARQDRELRELQQRLRRARRAYGEADARVRQAQAAIADVPPAPAAPSDADLAARQRAVDRARDTLRALTDF